MKNPEISWEIPIPNDLAGDTIRLHRNGHSNSGTLLFPGNAS
jgi:hypothetical protein